VFIRSGFSYPALTPCAVSRLRDSCSGWTTRSGVRRAPDGNPNLTAPTPRTEDERGLVRYVRPYHTGQLQRKVQRYPDLGRICQSCRDAETIAWLNGEGGSGQEVKGLSSSRSRREFTPERLGIRMCFCNNGDRAVHIMAQSVKRLGTTDRSRAQGTVLGTRLFG
jgi:hypothetical protein